MSSTRRPRTTYKEKTMLNLLHVYTSPDHGSSVLRYWPMTHVTHCICWPIWPMTRWPIVCSDHHIIIVIMSYLWRHGICLTNLHSNRRCLRSSSSSQLVTDLHRCPLSVIVSFPVAGSRLWKSLPPDVTSALTIAVF